MEYIAKLKMPVGTSCEQFLESTRFEFSTHLISIDSAGDADIEVSISTESSSSLADMQQLFFHIFEIMQLLLGFFPIIEEIAFSDGGKPHLLPYDRLLKYRSHPDSCLNMYRFIP